MSVMTNSLHNTLFYSEFPAAESPVVIPQNPPEGLIDAPDVYSDWLAATSHPESSRDRLDVIRESLFALVNVQSPESADQETKVVVNRAAESLGNGRERSIKRGGWPLVAAWDKAYGAALKVMGSDLVTVEERLHIMDKGGYSANGVLLAVLEELRPPDYRSIAHSLFPAGSFGSLSDWYCRDLLAVSQSDTTYPR